jgi:hypothetical protein
MQYYRCPPSLLRRICASHLAFVSFVLDARATSRALRSSGIKARPFLLRSTTVIERDRVELAGHFDMEKAAWEMRKRAFKVRAFSLSNPMPMCHLIRLGLNLRVA